jgi:uncharacterized Fe-S cluster protein YjdI
LTFRYLQLFSPKNSQNRNEYPKIWKSKNTPNGEVTAVSYKPKCIHSAICFRGLPQVFDLANALVTTENGKRDEIINQVKACPSAVTLS